MQLLGEREERQAIGQSRPKTFAAITGSWRTTKLFFPYYWRSSSCSTISGCAWPICARHPRQTFTPIRSARPLRGRPRPRSESKVRVMEKHRGAAHAGEIHVHQRDVGCKSELSGPCGSRAPWPRTGSRRGQVRAARTESFEQYLLDLEKKRTNDGPAHFSTGCATTIGTFALRCTR